MSDRTKTDRTWSTKHEYTPSELYRGPRRKTPLRADNPKPVRRAIEDDRHWFLRHPNRTARLRNPVPGEAEAMSAGTDYHLPADALGYPLRIAVVRLSEGYRSRRPVWTRPGRARG